MKLANIVWLYAVRLRARLVQELFAVLGIAVGVALLFASQVANTSLSGSVQQLTSEIVGKSSLQVESRGPNGFNERLLGEVQRLPGVRQAAPVLETSAYVAGPGGGRAVELIGLDPSFAHLDGALLHRFSAEQLARQHVVALPAPMAQKLGVEPLSLVTVQASGRRTQAVVGLTLQGSNIGALADSPFMAAPLRYAQQLAGMTGRISRVLVEPRKGLETLVRSELSRLAGGGLNVRPANFDATIFAAADGPINQSGELFSVISALVGFLFAFNALLLTVPQRKRLIVDLRLDGYTPWEVAEVLLFDALVLGIAGSVAGLLFGDLLSGTLLRANPGYLSFAFPVGTQRIVSWQCFAVAIGGGLLAACVGVLNPFREIFKRTPIERTNERTNSRMSMVTLSAFGGVCLAITTAILIHGVSDVQIAIVGFVCLLAATLLLLPAAMMGVVAAFDFLQRRVVGIAPRLAVIELQSSSVRMRSAAVAATGAIAVFGSVAIEGAQRNLQVGLNHAAAGLNLVTSLWVAPTGSASILATVPFNGTSARERFVKLRGEVEAVNTYRGSFLDIGDQRTLVIGPPRSTQQPVPSTQLVSGDLAQANARLRARGWAAVSQNIAGALHLHMGQRFVLPTPRPTVFRLAAITTNLGWPPGAVIVNADDYARAWGTREPSAYQIELARGRSASVVEHDLRRVLGADSGLAVQTAAQRERTDEATQRQGLARLTQIAVLVLVAAVLAMAAAMGAMLWQRRPRLAAMKVDGCDHGELWRALLWESGLLLGAGCSIGALLGVYGQLLLSHALASATGFPVVFSVAAPIALGAFAVVCLTALAIIAIPGYIAARVEPALQA